MLRNKIVNYIFSRYAVYFLQLINTLVLVKRLSPFEFGIWGFIQMILLYFLHLDFGIPSSFNALASIHKSKSKYVSLNFNAAFTLTIFICLLTIFLFYLKDRYAIPIGRKYNFYAFQLYVIIIIVLANLNKLMMNLFRVYNNFRAITFYQACIPISIFITYTLFKDNLIIYLLKGLIVANIIPLLIFLFSSPIKIKLNFSKRLLIQIQNSGIYFFIYNASFYFILLSTRSIISQFYTVEEFGQFNFAISISNIIELSVSSFGFLVFPKILNRLASYNDQMAFEKIEFIQSNYLLVVTLISYLAIAFFPIVTFLFPSYVDSISAFNFISLTNIIYSYCFGSPMLLMARKKERKLALIAFMALVMNFVLTVCIVHFLKIHYSGVLVGMALVYLVYVVLVNWMCRRELKNFNTLKELIVKTFPLEHSIPLLLGFLLFILNAPIAIFPIVLIVYIIFNFKSLIELKNTLTTIIKNSSAVDV
jgi:O-antigen/teichoic acid export membrane protein